MLKNREIIAKLTEEEKLELAASLHAFSRDTAERAGLSPFRRAELAQIEETFPAFGALANSWNAPLAGEIYGALARRKAENDAALCFVPSLALRAHPCGEGISEDPCLLGRYATEIAAAVRGAGALPCFSILPEGKSAAVFDGSAEPGALYDTYLAPLSYLPEKGMVVSVPRSEENCGANLAAARRLLFSFTEEGGAVLCKNADGRAAATLAEGCVLVSGEKEELAAAHTEYLRLQEAVKRCEILPSELEKACRTGRALSDEMIDAAADRAIELSKLVFSARENFTEGSADTAALARRAAEESAVLLTNDGLLPLAENCSVAVFGAEGEGLCAALEGEKLRCAGFLKDCGEQERGGGLPAPASELAAKADVSVVFLSGENGSSAPALIGAIRRVNPNLIAVIPADGACDVAFRKGAAAILAANAKDGVSCAALAGILSGRVSPSGRLAFSRYADTEKYAAALERGKKEGKFKTGSFLGYRRDEAEKSPAAFPFGHGLSYSAFEYSDLKIRYAAVEVTVKNVGPRDACEVVQLYTGKADSALPRPKKELKAFQKIFLRAGESKKAEFRIPPSALRIGCGQRYVTEDGTYEVYVGSSCEDIRLTGRMRVRGEKLIADEDPSAYLRNRSNVLSGNYTLDRILRLSARGEKQYRAGLALLLVACISALFLGCMQWAGIIRLFESDDIFSYYLVFVCPVLLIVGAVLLPVGARRRKKYAEVVSEGCAADAVITQPQRYEELFDAQFARPQEEKEPAAPQKKAEAQRETNGAFDPSFTLTDAAENLIASCAFRGVSIEKSGARRLLSAFCASRLIFFELADSQLLPAFAEALGDFFGGAYYEDGFSRPFGAEIVAEAARKPDTVCAVVLGGGHAPQAQFSTPLSVLESESGQTFPPNVWFLCAAEGEDAAPAAYACRIRLELSQTASVGEGVSRTLGYRQFVRLSQKCDKEYCLDEEKCWKKIDKLESAAAKSSPFCFGNKAFLKTERFSSAFLAMGGEESAALDEAVAACLLPALAADGERLTAAEKELEEERFPESRRQIALARGSTGEKR